MVLPIWCYLFQEFLGIARDTEAWKMCDITRANFERNYDQMIEAFTHASFIAFDAEYTSLYSNNALEKSLSDTAEVRYEKLRRIVTQSCMCQLGISAYVPHKEKQNSYAVQTFNCYLFPQSFGPVAPKFVCQSSAIEFLCEYNFDFNKFLYEGVPYLNKYQEHSLRKLHKKGRLTSTFDAIKIRSLDSSQLKELRQKIKEWSLAAKNYETIEFYAPSDYLSRYILLTDLREIFHNVLCKYEGNDKIHVTKVVDQEAVKKCFEDEFERLFQVQVGFSKVIKKISSLRKPIVGHNCLADLLFIFKTFHNPLPDSYREFKRQLHDLFPVIYDTKHLSLQLRQKMMNETVLFQETRLEDLHDMLNSPQGKFYVLYSPHIEHAPGFDRYVTCHYHHEAGYDSFLTGYVFLRMAHFIAAKDIRSTELRPLSFKDQLKAISDFENRVNIARAVLRYINFGGNDPPNRSKSTLIVTLRQNTGESLSAKELAQEFLRLGIVDVELESSVKAIVTVSNSKEVKNILAAFRLHRKYKVTSFSSIFGITRETLPILGCGILMVLATGGFVYLLKS